MFLTKVLFWFYTQELNVRILTVTSDKHKYGVRLKGVLNHRTLGSKFKQSYKAITTTVNNMETDDLEKYLSVSFNKYTLHSFLFFVL